MVAAESLLAGALAKGTTTWLSSMLTDWCRTRKTDEAENKAWIKIVSGVLQHTKGLAERYTMIKTVAFPRESVRLDAIYVPLTLQEINRASFSLVIDSFPEKAFEASRKILIVDVAGMGKSTVSKVIFLRCLSERKALPILIDLRRLDGSESLDLSLAKQFGVKTAHQDLFSEFLRTQPLVFLFDGFDEVAGEKKLEVARLIRDFVDRTDVGRFIITSRPELPFSDYTDFTSFKIKELNREEAHSLITKYGSAYKIEDRAKALLEELKARHDGPVESFLKNPLLASLLFQAFEFKSVIPVKRGVFYRQVFDALFETHDLNKETGYVREKKTGLHHDDFLRAVRAIAKLFRERRVVEVGANEFLEMAKTVSKSLCPDLSFTAEAFLGDVVNAVPIFVRDGQYVRWAHKSLMDYFLCEFLLRDYSESKEEALHANAFGIAAQTNENFLVLVHEADPILFAQAVTIPAITLLIKKYEQLVEVLPKTLPAELAGHAAVFFMNYEVVCSVKPFDYRSKFTNGYVPLMIYELTNGSLGIFLNGAAAALNVPALLGRVPRVKGYEIFRNYSKHLITPKSLDALQSSLGDADSFLDWRKSKDDWEAFEDEFQILMGMLHSSSLELFQPTSLMSLRDDLEILVATSLEARSRGF